MDRLFVTLQYLLPQHLLGRLVYALTRSRRPWLKNCLIRAFVRHYRPRMHEAAEPDPLRYGSFNEFFTRALQPAARPIDAHAGHIVSPCDALVSMAGRLQDDELLQAKGQRYSLRALLADDAEWSERLRGGSYVTLYLAPHDYHRIHMPLTGRLLRAWHVPGRLFSVNAVTAAHVPGLFARNERVICTFEGEGAAFVVILVGALFVGSMSTVWHQQITPWRARPAVPPGSTAVHAGSAPAAATAPGVHALSVCTSVDSRQPRGAELGRFNMGSTVIVLLPAGSVTWGDTCRPGTAVKVGQPLGDLGDLRPAP